jgi:hypothetical protein
MYNITEDIIKRFKSKIAVRPNGCHEWTSFKDNCGYGRFMFGSNGVVLAHRVAWEIANGPIPEGIKVLHKCDNPKCVNPEHLFLGTQQDNMNDMYSKGRGPVGEKASSHKLTKEQVIHILNSYRKDKRTITALAKEYSVSYSSIKYIVKRRTWKHLQKVGTHGQM